MGFTYNGYTLQDGEWLMPNYAFTQINPLPFSVPVWGLTIWKCELNMLYILGLYAAYVAIFYAMNGGYYAFLAIRKKALSRSPAIPVVPLKLAESEAAATDAETDEDTQKQEETV